MICGIYVRLLAFHVLWNVSEVVGFSCSVECTPGDEEDISGASDIDENDEVIVSGLKSEGGNQNDENSANRPPPIFTQGQARGYDQLKADTNFEKPPPPLALPKDPKLPDYTPAPVITEDSARQALVEYVTAQCCWGTGAAKKLTIKNMVSSTSYHYILETFTEGRKLQNVHEPFTGQPIDGPQNGPAPGPWDIPALAKALFENEIRYIEVPHTAYVKTCHRCEGCGFLTCGSCGGRGRKRCGSCGGRGRKRRRRRRGDRWVTVSVTCFSCHGTGKRTCGRCSGTGRVTCSTCQGHCQLKWYTRLEVKWENIIDNHVVEKTELPDELILQAQGSNAFQDTQPRLPPIVTFPEPEINMASSRLLNAHQFGHLRNLMQRQTIRMVPVTQVYTLCKDKEMQFIVFGLENQVYAPDYPDTCCWGCTIL
ncbi:hypothetical protein FSP39_002029 [Pinctada imbricata]|uniref:Protein SSUH2 homolog n=1 Tax=Pinctada imbricata TaxID=66713 RepID=A0AA89C656_PINIB|nr:hypothetical protein FSP39_002029 [Pinctada imbricata]